MAKKAKTKKKAGGLGAVLLERTKKLYGRAVEALQSARPKPAKKKAPKKAAAAAKVKRARKPPTTAPKA
jgi:hypothetical protein